MEKILGHRIYDRHIRLYSTKWGLFPNGAKNRMQGRNYSPMQRFSIALNEWVKLRDYQQEAIEHVKKWAWGLIEAATGSGKSLMCIWITTTYRSKTLIVCPTKKLVKEMVDKFVQFTWYEPWTYYSDWKNIKDVTITTTASFVSDMTWDKKELQWAQVVIIDECDDKISDKFIDAICHYDCNVLVGMTWTPNRQDLDCNDLQLIFWPHIKVWDYQIMPTHITQHVYNRSESERWQVDYTNWASIRESMIHNDIRFKATINKIKELSANSFLTLILLDRNEDVDKYWKEFPEWLIITWSTKVKDDEAWIEKLKKTWGIIIWSLKKMYRWVDIPEIDNVIIASPIRFENTVVQAIWRALRKTDNKTNVDINIINDTILKNQRYEQAKVCKNIYNKTPEVLYFSNKLYEEKTITNWLHDPMSRR